MVLKQGFQLDGVLRGAEASGSRYSCKGFTLIELLVVIAIIVLLVSILVPSLKKARDLARATVCAVTEKGLGSALTQVAFNENNGRWLSYRDGSRDWPTTHPRYTPEKDAYWTERVRLFLGGRTTWHTLRGNGYTQEKNESEGGQYMICPSDTTYQSATPSTDWYWVYGDSFSRYASYGLNRDAFGLDTVPDTGVGGPQMGQLKSPGSTVLLAESESGIYIDHNSAAEYLSPGAFAWSTPLASGRHGDRVNVVYADGHVEAHYPEDLLYDTTSPNTIKQWFGRSEGGSQWWR